jgi:hypothetical protein
MLLLILELLSRNGWPTDSICGLPARSGDRPNLFIWVFKHLAFGLVDSYGLRDPSGGPVDSGQLGCVIIQWSRLISPSGRFVDA